MELLVANSACLPQIGAPLYQLVRLHGQRAENAKTLSFVTHAMARTLIAQQYGARDPLMDQIDM